MSAMTKIEHTYRATWQGIQIQINYVPNMWNTIAWIEVRSIAPEHAPLPITQTGYRLHFHPIGTVEAMGGDVVAQVIAWLDEEAANPAWQDHLERSMQGELL